MKSTTKHKYLVPLLGLLIVAAAAFLYFTNKTKKDSALTPEELSQAMYPAMANLNNSSAPAATPTQTAVAETQIVPATQAPQTPTQSSQPAQTSQSVTAENQISASLRNDPSGCNNGTMNAGAMNACFLPMTFTNNGDEPIQLTKVTASFTTTDSRAKLDDAWFYGNKGSWSASPVDNKAHGNIDLNFSYPVYLYAHTSVNADLLATSTIDMSGTVTAKLISYATTEKTIAAGNSLTKTTTLIPNTNVGTLVFDVPEANKLHSKYFNNVIPSGATAEVATFRVMNNLLDVVEIQSYTFKVESGTGLPYDQLFSNIELIESAVGYVSATTVQKIDSNTFTLIKTYAGGIHSGSGAWPRIRVKPLQAGTQFRIDLIGVQTKTNQQGIGFPVYGYQTFVQ